MKNVILLFICFSLFGPINSNAQSVSDQIENSLSAVVTVTVEKTLPVGKVLMGFRGVIVEEAYAKSLVLTNAVSSGSGFVVEKNGKKYIVTNAHVVESASDESGSLYVYSYNRKKYEVKIVGGDSFYDVAVLEFVTPPGKEFSSLVFANKIPQIASRVYAIGNPLGEYPYTVTDGIISAVNRVRDGVTGKYGFIQSTATIIWGNSGGPLINESGQVVGINSQIAFANSPDGSVLLMQQINFSLEPILAQRIVSDIIEKGKLSRAYLGVEFKQRSQIIKTSQGLTTGALIDNSPILSSLLKGTDASTKLSNYIGWGLTKVNANEIRNMEEAFGEFEKIKPNSQVRLTLTNGTTIKEVSVTTTELKPANLEELAVTVLQKIPNLLVDSNSPQVKIYTQNTKGMSNQSTGYYLVGGGSVASDDLWRVTTLSDLGALLRIYGLRGGVEYMITSESNFKQEPQTINHFFSDRNDVFQTMLWY